MNQRHIAVTWPGTILFILLAVTSSARPISLRENKTTIFNGHKYFDDDKKPARKERAFKNQNVVRVWPDAIKKTVHVIARPGNKKDIDFLVFDVNGNMVIDYKMKAGERKTISDLLKGAYMYYVFAEDEYLMTGKIVFR